MNRAKIFGSDAALEKTICDLSLLLYLCVLFAHQRESTVEMLMRYGSLGLVCGFHLLFYGRAWSERRFAQSKQWLFALWLCAVMAFGALTLRLQCAVFPIQAIVFSGNMMMQTIGMAGRASLLSMARNGVCFIPVILILPPLFGALGVQMAQACADVLAFCLAVPLVIPVLNMLKRREEETAK